MEELFDESTGPGIWRRANEFLASEEYTGQSILKKFRVEVLCTTDDPIDDLEPHKKIAALKLVPRVYPAYRPDKALNVDQAERFNSWVEHLADSANIHIASFKYFLDALRRPHYYFHKMGCRLSDHGL